MKKHKKRNPAYGMILEQRDFMYHSELRRWMDMHKDANAVQIEETQRRLAKKWMV